MIIAVCKIAQIYIYFLFLQYFGIGIFWKYSNIFENIRNIFNIPSIFLQISCHIIYKGLVFNYSIQMQWAGVYIHVHPDLYYYFSLESIQVNQTHSEQHRDFQFVFCLQCIEFLCHPFNRSKFEDNLFFF